MDKREIKKFLNDQSKNSDRNIVIIDFANVDRWQDSLGWAVGLKQLGQLIKHISGKKFLRRFYYGEDFGPKSKSIILTPWSERIKTGATFNGFEIVSKRVKYIPDQNYSPTGLIKKCNLDVEMALDLIKEQANYDSAFIFSGDGDMACVCKYLHEELGKTIFIFCARDHIGKELIDGQKEKFIKKIIYVEDFEYRLDMKRK